MHAFGEQWGGGRRGGGGGPQRIRGTRHTDLDKALICETVGRGVLQVRWVCVV